MSSDGPFFLQTDLSAMAPIFHFLLFISIFSIGTVQSQQLNISLNASLTPTSNTPWLSPSTLFSFGFYAQGDGFAVGIWLLGPSGNKVIVWTANRDNPPVADDAILLLAPDGRLVLRSRGEDISISNTKEAASYASMLDSGNFALYNLDSQIIWQTFDSPTDTLLPGQPLLPGKELFSSVSETDRSTGRFRLKMQTDGRFVLYPVETTDTVENAYWSRGTENQGSNISLNLNSNGVIYLVSSSGSYVLNITESLSPRDGAASTIIYRATFDFDGVFRLYSHRFDGNGSSTTTEEWPRTSRKCEIKGFCGLNSFCTQNDTEADCSCPRGFDFVDSSQRFRGCTRNFVEEGCGQKKQSMEYGIDSIKNTLWEDNPYSVLFSMSEEECREACLGDCNCEAAMFKDGICRKQKLPLRYGRRNLDNTTVSLIKFGVGRWESSNGITRVNERKEILITGIVLLGCSVVVLGISGFIIYRHRIWRYKLISETRSIDSTGEEFAPRPFTYHELEKATSRFKEELGKGAFGTVYRGALSNGKRIVAVKRLDNVVEEGEREFQTEVQAIGRTHHRNLVRLLGFCSEGPSRLLVYEYMSNGSLASVLFSPGKRPNWNDRVRIAMDIARGLLYLHEECEAPIIHCDIKPQNILMDEFNCAKISDFGLAKLMRPDQTRTYTGIRGTRGYVAPEWHKNMPITVKADVYSFGILLLEIVCCRRNVETMAKEEERILCQWVYDCFEDSDLGKLVNHDEANKKSLEEMVKVGLWCIQDKPSLRPTMKKVVLMLEGTVEVPTPPPISFVYSP